MKAFVELGLLCLSVCLSWAERPVTVECNLLMFRVLVNKNLFGDGVPVRPEELTLGMGCPVSRELEDKFELHYSVTQCGIEFQAFKTYVVYKTFLHYVSLYTIFGRGPSRFPLSCKVSRTVGPKRSAKPDTPAPSREKERRALRMFPINSGPTYWTPELYQTLERRGNKPFLEQEVESRDWVSTPILMLSPVVCQRCHGNIGPSAS